jgi:hypothetical protein
MTTTFDRPGLLERPEADWHRDDAGRPWIKPDPTWTPEQTARWLAAKDARNGQRPYTRVTTYAEAILDGSALARWKMRRVALGMGRRPDYVVAAAALSAEERDKKALNDLAEKALEAAGPNAADIGTALHGFTERIDRGEPVGEVPEQYRADLDAYRAVVESLQWIHREERMVCDGLEVAGTPDGIAYCEHPDPDGVVGVPRIVDLKTGNIEYTAGKFSAQLGIYAHSALYDPETGARRWLADLSIRWGLVLHMPAGLGSAELRWLNLEHGWAGARLAGPVRRWRTVNHADLLRPLTPPEPRAVPDGKCAGIKRDGQPCAFKAVAGGFCARHGDQAGEDQQAAVPRRVAEVAAEVERALESEPASPLVAAVEQTVDRILSTSVDEAVESEDAADLDGTDDEASCYCVDGQVIEPWDHWPTCPRYQRKPDPNPEQNGNPTPHTSMLDPETAREAAQAAETALLDQIRACRTEDEMAMLYRLTAAAWTPQVKSYASRHRELLRRPLPTSAALFAAIAACESRGELHELWADPRNDQLWTEAHSSVAKQRWAELPPY